MRFNTLPWHGWPGRAARALVCAGFILFMTGAAPASASCANAIACREAVVSGAVALRDALESSVSEDRRRAAVGQLDAAFELLAVAGAAVDCEGAVEPDGEALARLARGVVSVERLVRGGIAAPVLAGPATELAARMIDLVTRVVDEHDRTVGISTGPSIPVRERLVAAGIKLSTEAPGQAARLAVAGYPRLGSAGCHAVSPPYVLIKRNITRDTRLYAAHDYVIAGAVHVVAGATLTIEDGTEVRIRNGQRPTSPIQKNALFFDPGSRLEAGTVVFKAAGPDDLEAAVANNGGLWFMGGSFSGGWKGITTTADPILRSSFNADAIVASWLGNVDPGDPIVGPDPEARLGDDMSGIVVLGVGRSEWSIDGLTSDDAGDNGLAFTASQFSLLEIHVADPGEDGLNMNGGNVEVVEELEILVPLNDVWDRDIFDFERDFEIDGRTSLTIEQGCEVNVLGIFGDQLLFDSPDMPPPDPCDCQAYAFTGPLVNGPAVVRAARNT